MFLILTWSYLSSSSLVSGTVFSKQVSISIFMILSHVSSPNKRISTSVEKKTFSGYWAYQRYMRCFWNVKSVYSNWNASFCIIFDFEKIVISYLAGILPTAFYLLVLIYLNSYRLSMTWNILYEVQLFIIALSVSITHAYDKIPFIDTNKLGAPLYDLR